MYVALGSNLNEPHAQVERAIAKLKRYPQVSAFRASTAVESAPVGYLDQPSFINAVVGFLTVWSLRDTHNVLKKIESELGKIPPKERFGPRTIDLDLLMYGRVKSEDPELLLPHPRLHERIFVLYPLASIAPELRVGGGRSVSEWLKALPPDAWSGFRDLGVPLGNGSALKG